MTQMNADKSATGSNGISRDLVQAPRSCATHEVSLCLSLHLRSSASSADDFFRPLLRIKTDIASASADGSPQHLSHIVIGIGDLQERPPPEAPMVVHGRRPESANGRGFRFL